ncbi:hypothetical protein [Nitrosospira sp. NpAV]|uniref:hypothetical protein n=1 Tax=Nitrosospira sp. NpAV TaxID=58133 RepID=UPI0005A13CC4|nr:hypothetical protein [Nitrosospira sp. NpAV]KIO50271.1 hypothetical protein SQ11_00775 [Nitrosospira sp. NpAV]
MKKVILASILLLVMSACSTPILRTTKFPNSIFTPPSDSVSYPKSSTAPARIGVPYYLPQALIPITITLATNKPPADTPETKNSKIIKDKKTPELADAETPAVKPGTPMSPTPVSQKIGQYEVTIGAPLLIPDTSRPPFFLEYNPESATEDDIKIGVGANQLLQTIEATSIDKSGEAIIKLAEIGIRLAEIMALDGSQCPELEPVKIFTYLDPSSVKNEASPFSIDDLNDLLTLNRVPMKFSVTPVSVTVPKRAGVLQRKIDDLKKWKAESEKNLKNAKNNEERSTYNKYRDTANVAIGTMEKELKEQQNKATDAETSNSATNELEEVSKDRTTGLLFRTSVPYVLELSFGPEINMSVQDHPWCVDPQTHQMMVMAPNKGRVYAVDVNRGALITKKTNLTIVDGMLTKIDVTKPSSLIGVINIPLDILKLVLSVPGELLTLRVKRIRDERDMTQAQAEQLTYELQKYNNNKLLQDTVKPAAIPVK